MARMFKKSFMGGFRKKDVVKYLAEIETRHQTETEELKGELFAEKEKASSAENRLVQTAESERAALSKAESLTSELSELKAKAETAEEKAASLAQDNDELKLKNDELEKAASMLRVEIAELKGGAAELKARLDRAEKELALAKVELSCAKDEAEALKSAAKAKAECAEAPADVSKTVDLKPSGEPAAVRIKTAVSDIKKILPSEEKTAEIKKTVRAKISSVKKDISEIKDKTIPQSVDKVAGLLDFLRKK